ncbi:MAG TPA: EF-hand domain-containing protein [Sphingomicrobium sp.]|nr:EF-hand domain-containing protein [Sphingomicrobium sp.]
MMKFVLIGIAAAAVVGGSAAFAQAAQPTAGIAAHRPHTPRAITRADVEARVRKVFARLDTNHDGFITRDELSAIDAQREQRIEQRAEHFDPAKAFARLDLNHDGKITVAEAEAARAQHVESKAGEPVKAQATAIGGLFARADTNKDGVITRAEFDAMGEQIKARLEHAGAKRGDAQTRMFLMADTNKDGRISLAEMEQAALARFASADLNHDGTLSPEERQQAHKLFKGQPNPR